MTADPILLLAWLALAHLAADFVLQNDWIAVTKAASGRRSLPGLAVHVAIVALCLAPLPLAFGAAGLVALLAIALQTDMLGVPWLAYCVFWLAGAAIRDRRYTVSTDGNRAVP